jgi:hypothetical protein
MAPIDHVDRARVGQVIAIRRARTARHRQTKIAGF